MLRYTTGRRQALGFYFSQRIMKKKNRCLEPGLRYPSQDTSVRGAIWIPLCVELSGYLCAWSYLDTSAREAISGYICAWSYLGALCDAVFSIFALCNIPGPFGIYCCKIYFLRSVRIPAQNSSELNLLQMRIAHCTMYSEQYLQYSRCSTRRASVARPLPKIKFLNCIIETSNCVASF